MTRITEPWLTERASQAVCAMLTEAGHQAWFVGGCVRNALIGAPVSDLDISTDARPDRVMALADDAGFKSVSTGIDQRATSQPSLPRAPSRGHDLHARYVKPGNGSPRIQRLPDRIEERTAIGAISP